MMNNTPPSCGSTWDRRAPARPGAVLRLGRPFGRTLGIALLLLLAVLGLGEGIARTDYVQVRLPIPSIGLNHRFFEANLYWMDRAVALGESIDCVFLGDSTVGYNIDPRLFAEIVRQRTGRTIRCQNFSVSTLTPPSARLTADVLLKRYRPRVLVYFPTNALDLYGRKSTEMAVPWARVFLDILWLHPDSHRCASLKAEVLLLMLCENPWVRYQLGTVDLDGWLREHSYLYRDYLIYRNWLRPDFMKVFQVDERRINGMTPYGFRPSQEVMIGVGRQDNQGYFGVNPQAPEILALGEMIASHKHTTLVFAEMPSHPDHFEDYANGEAGYHQALDDLERFLAGRGAIFWRLPGGFFIPDSGPDAGWKDLGHMNSAGARVYTTWLAGQFVAALQNGQLSLPEEP